MPITRTTLLSGPACATYNGHTFFAHDGILVTPALELAEVASDAQGLLDATVTQTPVTIQFTPSAPFADLIALYPWTLATPGASLFGSADSPLVLIAANGVRLTFAAVAIIAMPDLFLSNKEPATGSVTFLALGSRSASITAANRFITIDTATIPSTPTTPPQLADDFALTWGTSPWTNLRSRDGIKIHFTMKTTPVPSDANALLDLTLDRLEITTQFTPVSATAPQESDLIDALQIQGPNATPGRPLSATANTLDIAGDHLFIRLPLAQLTHAEMKFDALHPRLGQLTFQAERALLGTTAPQPLLQITEGAPLPS